MSLEFIRCFSIYLFILYISSTYTIEPIIPEISILQSDGNLRQVEDVALVYQSHITLICRIPSSDHNITWSYSNFDSNVYKSLQSSEYLSVVQTDRGVVELKLSNIQFEMAGTYQCSTGVAQRQINVHVYGILQAIGSDVKLDPKNNIDPHSEATVACQFRVGRNGIKYTTIRWKGGKYATNPELYNQSLYNDEWNGYIWSNLSIKKPSADKDLYGKYTCMFNVISGRMESAEVEISIPPVFEISEDTMSVKSDQDFSYLCNPVAYPPITGPVEWTWEDRPIVVDEKGEASVKGIDWKSRVRLETVHYPNDKIMFSPVEKNDRATYKCTVWSSYGNATAQFYLRVKDQWAVVWPLMGIAVEAVLLLIIIGLYELKRRKSPKNQLDLTDGLTVNSPTAVATYSSYGTDEDVYHRHRNT